MSDLLRSFFTQLSPADVTDFFLVIMLLVFVSASVFRVRAAAEEFVSQAPALITSLGILGTFTGIIIGLFEFRIDAIDASIGTLLEGLKTAFITSVCGITLALILRFITRFFSYAADLKKPHADINDLFEGIKSLQVIVAQGQEQQVNLHSQLLEDLGDHVGTQIVLQLEQVVSNFNQRIENQFGENMTRFGENFGQFHAAVDALNEEFKRHEERIQYWTEHCDSTVISLLQMGKDFSKIEEKTSELPGLMADMTELVASSKQQVQALNGQLTNYSDISEKLQQFVPDFSNRLDRFSGGMELIQQVMDNDLQASLQAINRQSELLENQIASVSSAFEKMSGLDSEFISSLVQETATTHRSAMQELAVQQARTHMEMSESLAEVIRRSFSSADTSISKQYELIEHRMQAEIDEVMAAMGQALAGISGQFTRDYQQLIAQMKRILERQQELA